ncbi:guanine deaminase [Marinibactrum halimedae]|uniref:Guanine deaminase n=1 Tax=Marinibactrum halimedae TaxID=1444977 RepID=A0AA37WL96_9GAMM|nr:guanine deaminase [Marinibactrum halimedae]MCD9459673.1 guanine deaminase [Marinibactrum halimedae]GLS25699.1 guanine deaminase [Marinibactrum halimedae]
MTPTEGIGSLAAQAFRASILDFTSAPTVEGSGLRFYEDGILVLDQSGNVIALDHAEVLLPSLSQVKTAHFPGKVIMPGFIDSHIHFPQTDVIASYGEQLLDWLNNYTFPAEQRFADYDYASNVAEFFLDELMRCGTTTAMVYCTVHPQSVDAFFSASERRGSRMIAGKVLMDRHAPDALTDTAESGVQESADLIDRWHSNGRQLYCLTPRFAPTSTELQLTLSGELLASSPGVYMQTHLSENHGEIAWVKALFPERKHYLDVYDHYGLLGPTSVFAHGIHLSDDELQRLSDTGSSIAFCPTSNLFLGSGLFDLERTRSFNVGASIATDVGAGTSFSQLHTLNEAYKVLQLQGLSLHPFEAFYWLTLGNAKTLRLDDKIGNFETGKEADFIVMNPQSTPLMAYRYEQCSSLAEKLFLFMTLGDDRLIQATYLQGRQVYQAADV